MSAPAFDAAHIPADLVCRVCGQTKPLDQFSKHAQCRYGREARCRPCAVAHATAYRKANRKADNEKRKIRRHGDPNFNSKRKWESLWVRYGLTQEAYIALYERQGRACAICHSSGDGRIMHVDHCHATGEVRGLLCMNCNSGIGHLQDDPSILRAAIAYLEEKR